MNPNDVLFSVYFRSPDTLAFNDNPSDRIPLESVLHLIGLTPEVVALLNDPRVIRILRSIAQP